MQAYETLWDDVSKQILTQSSPSVLASALSTILYLLTATSLANTNAAKSLELEEEISVSLRKALAGRDELEVASFSEDEIRAIEAVVSRLAMLFSRRDLSSWMEEDEGGKQSTSWDIINALAERGRLGRKEEDVVCILGCIRLLVLPLTVLHSTAYRELIEHFNAAHHLED